MKFRLPVVIFGLLAVLSSVVKCETVDLSDDTFQDFIDKHLIVFVMLAKSQDLCMLEVVGGQKQPGVDDFEEAARTAKSNGMTKYLDMKFAKIDVDKNGGLANKYSARYMSCTAKPKLILFKYGKLIDYGSDLQVTITPIFQFLENNTIPSAVIIQTEDEFRQFVTAKEFSVLGYFKEGSKAKVVYWNLADRRKDYLWGCVTNQSLNMFEGDTIIVNRQYGANILILDKNLTAKSIENFVTSNAEPVGPILEMTDQNFQNVIDKRLLVFVIFYNPDCVIPSYFEKAAQIAEANGMTKFLDMKFGKVNIKNGSEAMKKYSISMGSGCQTTWENFVLFRYGKPLRYAEKVWSQKTETVKGIFEWLANNTTPAAKIIQTEDERRVFVEFTEVTILGYFKMDSKARQGFWKVADKLKDYKWAAVTNPYMDFYDLDTIVINQEYGVSRPMINGNLTQESIEKFVKLNANSTFPVPTKPVTADLNETMDSFHRTNHILFVYDGIFFFGHSDRIDIKKGCVDIYGNWEQEVRSIRTFGQCVKVYDLFGCKSDVKDGTLILNNKNIPVQEDLGLVGFHEKIRSIGRCDWVTSGVLGHTGSAANKGIMLLVVIMAWMIRNQEA